MNLPEKILNTIIDVSNGDMRKAIMLLQNLKYLYNFKNNMHKPINNMSIGELKLINTLKTNANISKKITESDIYEIAASIPMKDAHNIIDEILSCNSIIMVTIVSKKIIAMGYPIDNILVQLNKAILETNKINDEQKAHIINYSGKIFLKMKECANEYIQLSDYLASVYGIVKGINAYNDNVLK